MRGSTDAERPIHQQPGNAAVNKNPPYAGRAGSAETGNRTQDTAIFSRVLYQLSYLGITVWRDFTWGWADCQDGHNF
jgi:hypothetical protein